ncbi:hypothetical protein FRC17_001993 [Serendipita sp. 399]|nr:hypothetical protein FRC17_001993 [Serendipita sp. 399]
MTPEDAIRLTTRQQTLPPALDGGSLYCDEVRVKKDSMTNNEMLNPSVHNQVLPSWGGDTEPFIRPGSRLGFSNLTPRCGSTRVLVEEYEMEGAAVDEKRRKSLSSDDRGGFATPLALSISQNETPSTMSSFVAMPLTSPSEASTTPVLYHSEDEADTFASEDGVDRDTIEDLSPKISYDWTKAAHLFLQSSNIPSNQRDDKTTPGEKAVSVKRRGLWHNILEESSLWTIEETSDEERDASNGDNGSISYYSCRG